jgi:hypothetical protein
LFQPRVRFAFSATPRSCTDRNPTKWNPMETDSASATFTSTSCESTTENGSWWRRSWRARPQHNRGRSDFPCASPVYLCVPCGKDLLSTTVTHSKTSLSQAAAGSASATRGTTRFRPVAKLR